MPFAQRDLIQTQDPQTFVTAPIRLTVNPAFQHAQNPIIGYIRLDTHIFYGGIH